jgi:hypothetical protein
MADPSMCRSKTGSNMPRPNTHVQEPHDVGSKPILDRQNPDMHGANQTVAYSIYSQEPTSTDWASKRPLNACYTSFLRELSDHRGIDCALSVDVNGLCDFLIMPRAFDTNWGQWHIHYFLPKKSMPRECIRRWEPNGQPNLSGSLIWRVV